MPINKSNIKPFACRVTRINGTRNKSITSNLARKGLNIVSIMVLIGLSTFCLIPIDSTSATTPLYFSVDSDPSMSITLQNASNVDLTNNSSTLNITPTNDGTFGKQDINILVGTNNRSGYTLFMVADTTTSLEGSSNVDIEAIPTKSNGYTENEFISSSDTLNKWGYMIKSTRLTSGTDYVPNYNPMKTTNIKINSYNTNTAEPDRTTINFATKLNNAIPSGSYGSTINFIATANPVTYTINYNKGNATNAVAGIPSSVTNTSDSAVTISNTTPTRTAGDVAATFNGWCDKNPTFVNGTETCPGNTYQPSSELPFSVISVNETTTLYAMWTVASGQAATTAMQNLTTASCPTTAAKYYDARDLKVYWVQKLNTYEGNPKCWMIQALDLDLANGTTLTHYNTDLGYTNTNPSATWNPERSTLLSNYKPNNANGSSITPYTGGTQNTGFVSNWVDSNDDPYSVDPGNIYVIPTYTTSPSNWYTPQDTIKNSLAECNSYIASVSGFSTNFSTDCSHYAVGNYYNFAAATATDSVEGTLGGSESVVNYAVMPDSICPAGWRLPTGLTNTNQNDSSTTHSEFSSLLKAYNVISTTDPSANNATGNVSYLSNTSLNTIRGGTSTSSLYFTRPGYVSGGALGHAGVNSLSWSSTISGSSTGYRLDFNSTDVYPASSLNRLSGFSVRCVAR
ncbi:hypothetical protein IKE79_00480 [Candidatus Saccharibacteria bacterium]|nr:hypothetical protein [Candidatus Saccharibacteria bacterium]